MATRSVNGLTVPLAATDTASLHGLGEATLLAGALDTLPLRIAVIDPLGIIRSVNRRWRDFAQANGGGDGLCDGGDYLGTCRRAASEGSRDAEEAMRAIERVLSGQQAVFELEYACVDGTRTWWYLQRIATLRVGAERWALVTHEDITDRRSALEVVEIERTKLQTLLDMANDGIHVTEMSGSIVFFSDSFARMLGYTKEEMSTLSRAAWSTDSAAANSPEDLITVYRCKDGSLIHVEVRQRCIWLAGVPYVYGSARDVTARHREDDEKQRHLVELERINQELDDFVYVASHDLRSPLRAVSTLAQWIIEDDPNLQEKTSDRLSQIQSRARRMSQLLDDIQQYARAGKDSGPRGLPLTASALAAEVIATLQVPPSFTVEVSAALDGVLVQRMPFEQVLHNLLGNAIKHHDKAAGHILIDVTKAAAGFHRFFVEDDGPGIPEAYRETVFEMFSTLKPRDEVEGSGMGLALVRKLVTRLGGTCGIQDIRGRGTRMWFDWPRS